MCFRYFIAGKSMLPGDSWQFAYDFHFYMRRDKKKITTLTFREQLKKIGKVCYGVALILLS